MAVDLDKKPVYILQRMKMRTISIFVFVLIVSAWRFVTPLHSQEMPSVIVARATVLDFPLVVEGLGNARANESIDVRPRISSRVTAIRFSDGQHVERGDVLVELEDAELRAAVAEAKAELVDSESKYERGKELFESKLIADADVESLRAQRDADRAALDAAEARMAEATVRAPFSGRVGLRRVSLGSLVAPATVITTLDDTDTIKLDFDVPETAFARVAQGLRVVGRSAAYPDSIFEGRVQSVDTRIDPVSRTVTVRALVPNPHDILRPGMFLTVKLFRDNVTALMIPEQTIVPEQSRQYVLVVSGEGIVEKREVKVGRRRPGQVEILDGLSDGELVVAEGTQKATPGSAVSVVGQIEVTP